ncbi:EVE domain-containing protein [Oryzibacter oryziterrae]|uniref:EVE domain-containing protein n=1 Tax=Oryzibacter oryziterrae TaxID=2766474 RepID=UPI001F44A0AB|nr:EVE domain-containing protein [Oryzibacter oryziterrae]
MARFWIGVASAEHVRIGRAGGFMQLCHGKAAPLRRLRPGDGVAYYSPSECFGARDGLQAFTAIGAVRAGEAYLADMGGGFHPYRRDVTWWSADEVPIRPLLDELVLTAGKRSWGAVFRFGFVEVGLADFAVIAKAMRAEGGGLQRDLLDHAERALLFPEVPVSPGKVEEGAWA